MNVQGLMVRGDSGTVYVVTVIPAKANVPQHVMCACPSWRFKKVPVQDRTCKHIEFAKTALRLPVPVN